MKRQFFLLLIVMGFMSSAFAQEYFGQNKVQYDQFHFSIYQTPHFSIYYYPEEAEAAKMIAQMAEIWYDRYSKIFNYQFTTPTRSFSMQVLSILLKRILFPESLVKASAA